MVTLQHSWAVKDFHVNFHTHVLPSAILKLFETGHRDHPRQNQEVTAHILASEPQEHCLKKITADGHRSSWEITRLVFSTLLALTRVEVAEATW